jgi:DNA (cytosine-5)-methyltransferase 1
MGVKQLTAVSLFAGVGGFDLALERSGVKVVASVEIDQKASAVLAKQFPNSKLYNDVKEVTGEQLIEAGFDPRNGIITGGFPCQDLSMAGRRAGLGGARSGLFWEICRLLEQTKSQYFILENVPGLLSSNQGKDMATVLEALVERGYRIAFRVLDAQYFGVPQRRRRVFIVGSFGNTGGSPEQILAIADGRARYIEASKSKGQKVARKITKGVGNSEWWNGKDVADTLTVSSNEQRMPDKNKMQMIVFSPHREDGARVNENVVNTLLSSMGTGGNNMPMVAEIKAYDEYNDSISDTHHTLRSGTKQSTGVLGSQVRRLTPLECERLQGFPDGWTADQVDTHRYKQMGNAVAVPVVEWIIQGIVDSI